MASRPGRSGEVADVLGRKALSTSRASGRQEHDRRACAFRVPARPWVASRCALALVVIAMPDVRRSRAGRGCRTCRARASVLARDQIGRHVRSSFPCSLPVPAPGRDRGDRQGLATQTRFAALPDMGKHGLVSGSLAAAASLRADLSARNGRPRSSALGICSATIVPDRGSGEMLLGLCA